MDNPIRLHWLDPRDPLQPFPPVRLAMRDPNGLLAIGGDLSLKRLLRAYAQGIFPWFNPDEPILWWCPDPRAVLAPADFHASHSLRKRIRKADYAVTMDRAFGDVLDACAGTRAKSRGTWLGADMRRAYEMLHEHGYCHSVEIWQQRKLVGGLYGVALGRAFFGESMFSRADDASKLALYHLCQQLQAWHYDIIDCQISSAHLATLGAHEIPREEFLRRLYDATAHKGNVGPWSFDIAAPRAVEHLPGQM